MNTTDCNRPIRPRTQPKSVIDCLTHLYSRRIDFILLHNCRVPGCDILRIFVSVANFVKMLVNTKPWKCRGFYDFYKNFKNFNKKIVNDTSVFIIANRSLLFFLLRVYCLFFFFVILLSFSRNVYIIFIIYFFFFSLRPRIETVEKFARETIDWVLVCTEYR